MKGNVSTVVGALDPARLGVTDMHDHVLIGAGTVSDTDSDLLLDDTQEAYAELSAWSRAGGGTVVDALPAGCGRKPAELAELSRKTGVTIIATTGFHKSAYYPAWHWARQYSTAMCIELLLDEINEGIDRHDSVGPVVERTDVRPGLLKWGTSFHRTDSFEAKTMEVVATVHAASRLPVLTHAEHGTHAREQVRALVAAEVNPYRVAISHMDRNPDPQLHLEVVELGASVIYDGLYRESTRPVSSVMQCLSALVDAGFADRVMLGGDLARQSLRARAGTHGMAGLLTDFGARCRDLFGDAVWRQIFIDNPARFLASGQEP